MKKKILFVFIICLSMSAYSKIDCEKKESTELEKIDELDKNIKKILPPIVIAGKDAPGVFVDIHHARYIMKVDIDRKKVKVKAIIDFKTEQDGYPILDLVLPTARVKINKRDSDLIETNLPQDISKMKYIDSIVSAGKHQVVIEYEYDYPLIYLSGNEIQKDIKTNQNELFFGLSDLNDRGYLERYLPTNIENDEYSYDLKIKFNKNKKDMFVVSNGVFKKNGRRKVKLKFNEFSNSSSIFLNIAEKKDYFIQDTVYQSDISKKKIPIKIYISKKYSAKDKDEEVIKEMDEKLPESFQKEVLESIKKCEELFGPWPGDKLIVKGRNSGTGGMEYAMATDAALPAIQHELLHSYFGRGIKNTDGNSGWLDEASVVWLEEYIENKHQNISGNDKNSRLVDLGAPLYLTSTILGGRNQYRRNSENKAYTYGGNFMSYVDYLISKNSPNQGLIDVLKVLVQTKMHQSWDNEIFLEAIKKETGLDLKDEFAFYIEGKPLHQLNYKKIIKQTTEFEEAKPHLNEKVKIVNSAGETSAMLLAASGNSVEAFEYFYQQNPEDLFKKDKYGRGPLSYALASGNIEMVKRLKSLGFKNEDGPNGDAIKFINDKKNNFYDKETKKKLVEIIGIQN